MATQDYQGGSGNGTLQGNEQGNTLRGLGGNDTIYGGGGDDILSGGSGSDVLDGGAGIDTAVFSGNRSDYSLAYASSNSDYTLSLADKVPSRDGEDTIKRVEFFQFADGTFSLDDLLGLRVTTTGDKVDSVTLSDGVFDFVVNGGLNLSVIGNALDNIITGDRGKNFISGMDGSDTINGGLGNDTLRGGHGDDVFVFNTKLGTSKTDRKVNFDKIADFNVKYDSLWLDHTIFRKLGQKGSEDHPAKLSKDFFTIGTHAQDANDYLIYDKKTGILSYDVDGSGPKAAIEFAQLSKHLKLTYKDFFVI